MSKTRPTGKIRDNVFTSPDVVKYMLDLSGYTPDRDLSSVNVIEPSCGEGEFVIEIITTQGLEELLLEENKWTDSLNCSPK